MLMISCSVVASTDYWWWELWEGKLLQRTPALVGAGDVLSFCHTTICAIAFCKQIISM
jgi:hypothetical protein